MYVRRLVRLLAEPEVHQELLCEVITALGSFAHGTYILVHVCMYVSVCVYVCTCVICVYVSICMCVSVMLSIVFHLL